MIKLRELRKRDAILMLEWMHDTDNQKGFKKNMLSMTLKDVETFISRASISGYPNQGDDFHFAIVDDNDDEYLGTISLKNIDLVNNSAEYAIATRKSVQGKGVATEATRLVLLKAFNEYGLHKVYLNVLTNNIRAIRLYEKSGFILEGEFRAHIKVGEEYMNWKWYGIIKDEFFEHEFGGGGK